MNEAAEGEVFRIRRIVSGGQGGHTLQAIALVNESYPRLVGDVADP